jgi:Domain of unknown function (DUF6438)
MLHFLLLMMFWFAPPAAAPRAVDVPVSKPARRVQVITLERTICFGACPVYKLTIFSDGLVHYQGTKFVKKIGSASGRISRTKLNQLLQRFEEINYRTLPEDFTPGTPQCPQMATDMPSAITSLTRDGKTKTVRHYHGCRGLSTLERLTELEDKIDQAVNTKKWTGK